MSCLSSRNCLQPPTLKMGPTGASARRRCLHAHVHLAHAALSCIQNQSSPIAVVVEHTVRSPPARTSPAEFTSQGEAEERSMLSPQRHPIAVELQVSDCYVQPYLALFAGARCAITLTTPPQTSPSRRCAAGTMPTALDQAVPSPCTSRRTLLQN